MALTKRFLGPNPGETEIEDISVDVEGDASTIR